MKGGECTFCACTERAPCAGGCAWTDETRTLCTACLEARGLAAQLLEIVVIAGKRSRPFLSFGGDVTWDTLAGDQAQLLVMAVRAVLERVQQALAELDDTAVAAIGECDRIHAFLLAHCPEQLRDETSLGEVVTRLLEPHVGSRIIVPRGLAR